MSPAGQRNSGASRYSAMGTTLEPGKAPMQRNGAAYLVFPHAREYFVNPLR